MNISYYKNNKKGFTLVEALVAISILMVAIVTPMSIAQGGLGSAIYSKDQMTASYLAQDAIEFIKNKRDEIGIRKNLGLYDGNNWLEGLDKCRNTDCYIDTAKSTDNILNIPVPGPLYIVRDNEGKFLYYGFSNNGGGNSSQASKFTRTIRVTSPVVSGGSSDEALIEVKVSWGKNENIVIKNFIYNYWENL